MLEKLEGLVLNNPPAFSFLAISLLILLYQKVGLIAFSASIIAFLLASPVFLKGRHYITFSIIILSLAASVVVHTHSLRTEINSYEIKENQKLSGKVVKIIGSGILIDSCAGRVLVRLEQLDRFLLQISLYVSDDEIDELNLLKDRLSMYASLKKNCRVEVIVQRIYRRARAVRLIDNPWVVSGRLIKVEEPESDGFVEVMLLGIQEAVSESIRRRLDQPYGNILLGLLTGEKPYSEQQILTAFKRTGTMHILAVSGLHIGILYWLLRVLLKPFVEVSPVLTVILNIFLLMVFVAAIGAPSSGVRALIMVSVLELSRLYFRKSTLLDALFTASMIILIVKPGLLFDLSFQLSFSAVLGIAAGTLVSQKFQAGNFPAGTRRLQSFESYRLFLRIRDYVQTAASVILGIQVVQLPVSVSNFHGFPFIGAAANLFVVPLVAPAMLGGICLVILDHLNIETLALAVSEFLKFLLNRIIRICFFFSSNSLSYIYLDLKGFERVQQASALVLFFSLSIFLLTTIKKPKSKTHALFILLLSTFAFPHFLRPNGLILFDVGQGTSVLASTYDMSALFDVGPPGVNVIEKIIKVGASQPEHIFLSHYHLDHSGGLTGLIGAHGSESKIFWLPPPKTPLESDLFKIIKLIASKNGLEVRKVNEDCKITFCNGRLIVELFGSSGELNIKDSNERSHIYLIKFLKKEGDMVQFLYPSDCNAERLEEFTGLRLLAVVASHHGSITGFSKKFYDSFCGMVLVSTGKNSYGLPSEEFLNYLKHRRINTKITKKEGTIYCEAY
jgi:competence protein ComEC